MSETKSHGGNDDSAAAEGGSEDGREARLKELAKLHARARQLEVELAELPSATWPPKQYYAAYYATTGFLLGFYGAATSLIFNIIGSLLVPAFGGTPQNPLRLIQVYLTFPLGAKALELDSGLALAIGCCLYLGTGMVYGVFFQLALSWGAPQATLGRRIVLASILAVLVWLVNFYGILSWLQPLLFGGNWILELVPWWVALLTHLVYGWTMALVYPLGLFIPYRPVSEDR
jgi:hypothetical protein